MTESKYHNILAAVVSNIYRHSAFMLTDTGRLLRSECYVHDVPAIESIENE